MLHGSEPSLRRVSGQKQALAQMSFRPGIAALIPCTGRIHWKVCSPCFFFTSITGAARHSPRGAHLAEGLSHQSFWPVWAMVNNRESHRYFHPPLLGRRPVKKFERRAGITHGPSVIPGRHWRVVIKQPREEGREFRDAVLYAAPGDNWPQIGASEITASSTLTCST